jgi:hypothetical protein
MLTTSAIGSLPRALSAPSDSTPSGQRTALSGMGVGRRTLLSSRIDSAHDLACYALMGATSDIPEISVFEGAPDREPRDLVAGFFDGALDRLLLSVPSFE